MPESSDSTRSSAVPTRRHDYRPDIDGLRAVAVLSVVLFHFGWPGFGGGFVGVDVFFVISGFLITRLIVEEHAATGTFRFAPFYGRRIRRLFPALAFTLLASSIAAILIFSPEHLKRFARELMTAVLSVSNIFFYSVQGYFDVGKEFQALLHTWSLSVEEQFYLFWPLLLVFVLLRSRTVLIMGLLVVGLSSLAMAELWADRAAAFFLTPFRAFEFAIGAALVWAVRLQPADRRWFEPVFLIGLAMIVGAVHLYSEHTHLPGLLMLVPTVGAAMVIYAGQARTAHLLLANSLAVGIGRISYSLYLVHWPLLIFYGYTIGRPLVTADRLGLVAVSLILAAAMYRLVEQPFRYPAGRKREERRFMSGVAATGIVFLIIGGTVLVGEGWQWRLPPETARLQASAHRQIELQDECQFRSSQVTEELQERFDGCFERHGNAVLVFGDSHAGNLFNALAHAGSRLHVVAVQAAGCRPSHPDPTCFYDELGEFVAANSDRIDLLVFTQKGSYLLEDYERLPVDRDGMERIISYLEEIGRHGVPLLWVGPKSEPHFEVDKFVAVSRKRDRPDYLRDRLVEIISVDETIKDVLERRQASFEYLSRIDLLGPMRRSQFVIDGEYTYADTDHWSAKGEEVFGALLIERSERLRRFFGSRHETPVADRQP
ncbi:acyltransferase family protein [Chelativorans sp. ZYF759]|uniref:acyltransferase family protein n=1 Tax=Chelativorans sp. ZYF759 TaxID=2692213 RepID=UPI00145D6605|nr:acyltransferase family protein [Chelativorans sp. ZYF759]